jgi:hypothetical protein
MITENDLILLAALGALIATMFFLLTVGLSLDSRRRAPNPTLDEGADEGAIKAWTLKMRALEAWDRQALRISVASVLGMFAPITLGMGVIVTYSAASVPWWTLAIALAWLAMTWLTAAGIELLIKHAALTGQAEVSMQEAPKISTTAA